MKAGRGGKGWRDQILAIANANSFPVRLEVEIIRSDDYRLANPSAKFGRTHGHDLWATEIPANGSVSLSYRMKERRRR